MQLRAELEELKRKVKGPVNEIEASSSLLMLKYSGGGEEDNLSFGSSQKMKMWKLSSSF